MRWHDIYILLLALVFFCCASIVSAQNVIDVSECIKRSVVTKEAHLRKDRNGNICAVLQIEGPRIRDYKFECPYKVESVLYDEEHNQATVFVVADKKTKLTIFNPDCNKKIVELPALEGHYYYDLSVRVIDESRRNSSDADDDIIYDEKSTVELAFHVFPSNSTVVLRKLPERTDESGIVVRTVFPGQYHYRVNSDRYHEYVGVVDIPEGYEGQKVVNVMLTQAWGWLTLSHDIDLGNVVCYVDGEQQQHLPEHLELMGGDHSVRIEKPNYETFDQIVNITDSVDLELRPELRPLLGWIDVRASETDAIVRIDGEVIPTGRPYKIITGEHLVEVSKNGFRTEQRTVAVRHDETTDVMVSLQDFARFTITSSPVANLTINGEKKGMTPYSFDGSSGEYDIKLEQRKYLTFHKRLKLITSEPQRHFALERQYIMPTTFYVQAGAQVGSLLGVNVLLGAYIHNFNVEAFATIGLAESETIYWNHNTLGAKSDESVYKPMSYGAKLGYGLVIGSRLRVTPQAGLNIVSIKSGNGNSSGYAMSAAAGVRADYAIAGHFGVYVSPEYDFSVSGSEVFDKVSVVSSGINGWANGINIRAGVCLSF